MVARASTNVSPMSNQQPRIQRWGLGWLEDAGGWVGGKIAGGAEAAWEGAKWAGGKVAAGAELLGKELNGQEARSGKERSGQEVRWRLARKLPGKGAKKVWAFAVKVKETGRAHRKRSHPGLRRPDRGHEGSHRHGERLDSGVHQQHALENPGGLRRAHRPAAQRQARAGQPGARGKERIGRRRTRGRRRPGLHPAPKRPSRRRWWRRRRRTPRASGAT